jgi:hypothetical protein
MSILENLKQFGPAQFTQKNIPDSISIAAWQGDVNVTRFLLDSGFETDYKSTNVTSMTGLEAAVDNFQTEIVRILAPLSEFKSKEQDYRYSIFTHLAEKIDFVLNSSEQKKQGLEILNILLTELKKRSLLDKSDRLYVNDLEAQRLMADVVIGPLQKGHITDNFANSMHFKSVKCAVFHGLKLNPENQSYKPIVKMLNHYNINSEAARLLIKLTKVSSEQNNRIDYSKITNIRDPEVEEVIKLGKNDKIEALSSPPSAADCAPNTN